jgi:hypothetical protein
MASIGLCNTGALGPELWVLRIVALSAHTTGLPGHDSSCPLACMQALTANSKEALHPPRLVGLLRGKSMQLCWLALLSAICWLCLLVSAQVLLAADHGSSVVTAAGVGAVAVPLLLCKAR